MSKATILIIEDNPDNFELVRFLLDQEGYAVLGASDGRTGLEIAIEQKPQLILLDLAIPEIDGWTLAAKLKSDESTRHIVVVALTAYALPGDRKKALDAGCDGYITKPLDIPNFPALIASYLSGKKDDLSEMY